MPPRLEPGFGRLWSAYAVSTYGTWIAFGAFPLIAVRVLHSTPFAVALLEAAGLAVAAVAAVPLAPWVERRAKRPVMIGSDLVRCAAMASVPAAHLLGLLSYGQLLVVSVVSGTAGIVFTAASGAYLKQLVRGEHLLVANGRFEGTNWAATAAGPPLGGALTGALGPVVTVAADALSYLLSALAVLRAPAVDAAPRTGPDDYGGARTGPDDAPTRTGPDEATSRTGRATGPHARDFLAGWRLILHDRFLRRLFLNQMAVNGLIMATGPLLAVLLLGQYHVPAWQYGLAFALPALGGLAGARLSARLVARHGRHRVLTVTGRLRAVFPLGLVMTRPGVSGVLTVALVEGLLIVCMGVFNPISATERLRRAPAGHAARMAGAWSITSRLTQATCMVVWGVIATRTGPLPAIALSGVLLLATPLLLPAQPPAPTPAYAPDRTEPDHTGPDHTGPDHTGPDHTAPDRTGPDRRALD
ncbi:MFS transporter [Streptomyces sp. NPDC004065]|uniref:MFS transporter n=1 Tax=Streptomyces sp. NPDC004065 TaxID=3364689 RepID=UPI00384C8CD7